MTAPDFIRSLQDDRDRFALLAGADLEAFVPTCPDWMLRNLLVHLGRVNRWATTAIVTMPENGPPQFPSGPEPDVDLVVWVVEGLDVLITRLTTSDLSQPAWGFAGPVDGRFWLRRQAIETAVHRVDAQLATGFTTSELITDSGIEGDIATVGIDEWCELQQRRWFTVQDAVPMTCHLHATDGDGDGDGEWLIEVDDQGLRWQHGHHKGDIALRASRAAILLLIWNRLPTSSVELFGDPTLLESLLCGGTVS